MFNVKYDIIEEAYSTGNESRMAYGIAAYDSSTGVATVIASAHDVSCDKQAVCDLAQKCNDLELAPEHLIEVITDFLNEVCF